MLQTNYVRCTYELIYVRESDGTYELIYMLWYVVSSYNDLYQCFLSLKY